MSTTQNTPCGCRCNNADDTREKIILGLEDGVPLPGYFSAGKPVLYSEGGLVGSEFVGGLESEVGTHRGRGGDEEHDHGRVAILGRSHCVLFRSSGSNHRCDVVVSFPDELRVAVDSGSIDGQAAGPHCSSPVVAESEADTSDAPAMTVQEGGGSTAAPDLGGPFSPVPSTPRFVAIGEYVYDRELDRASDASNYIGGAPMIVERLLAGHFDANTLFEEDAK